MRSLPTWLWRVVVPSAVAVTVAAGFMGLSAATATAADVQYTPLPQVACNEASVALAGLFPAPGVLVKDQPKKGETGFVSGAVGEALKNFAALLGKDVTVITAKDVKDNPKLVQQAIADALKKGNDPLTAKDKAGNTVEVWCLDAGNGHSGPDIALLYIPAGKQRPDGVFIGGCLLGGGINQYGYRLDANGNFAQFLLVNTGAHPTKADFVVQYTFTFDPVKNQLVITAQQGKKNEKPEPRKDGKPQAPPSKFSELESSATSVLTARAPSPVDDGVIVTVTTPADGAGVVIAPPETGSSGLDTTVPGERISVVDAFADL